MQKQERLDPGWAWTKKYNVGAGVQVGDTIYTSGLVALNSDGNVIGEDAYTQSSQIFKNIENLLVVAGATMADVIKINTFLRICLNTENSAKPATKLSQLECRRVLPTLLPHLFFPLY